MTAFHMINLHFSGPPFRHPPKNSLPWPDATHHHLAMPRKKPFSAKQRKAQLQDRRALKRGEIDSLPIKTKPARRTPNKPPTSGAGEPSSRRLQSRFITVSPGYLAKTRDLAHSVTLPRPIPAKHAEFPIEILTERDREGRLTCPARPKFRVGATKKEVERNEEGWFRKWLEGIERVMRDWVEGDEADKEDEGAEEEGEVEDEVKEDKWPRSPAWFETNLEVWRQLYVSFTDKTLSYPISFG